MKWSNIDSNVDSGDWEWEMVRHCDQWEASIQVRWSLSSNQRLGMGDGQTLWRVTREEQSLAEVTLRDHIFMSHSRLWHGDMAGRDVMDPSSSPSPACIMPTFITWYCDNNESLLSVIISTFVSLLNWTVTKFQLSARPVKYSLYSENIY